MQQSASTPAPVTPPNSFLIDAGVAALAVIMYLLWAAHFQYRGTLADDDLYRMLRGLLDGAANGSGFASSLQYGKGFSFGYMFAMYHLVDVHILKDPQRLIALINGIGLWSAVAGSICFWASLWMLYGMRRATTATVLFLFSPIMLEQGTSGHAILVSFAFFSAATLVLFLPVHGFRAEVCSAAGAMLLLAALTMRADIMFAFPFVVLARADFRSLKLLIKSVLLRAIAPTLAVTAFFVLKHIFVDDSTQPGPSLPEFFRSYYKLFHIPIGIGVCLLGCGFFTVLLGLWAAVRMLRATAGASPATERRAELLQASIAPLALVLFPLAFWIADPAPARHFFLCVCGFSILVAWLATSLALPRWIPSPCVLACVIVLANQAAGAVAGPIILKRYPSKLITVAGQPRVMPHVPIGTSWRFHRAVQDELWSADRFAEVVDGLCDARTIVLTDHMPQLSSHIYGWQGHWTAEEGKYHRFSTLTARRDGCTIIFLSVHEGWPQDPVATVLADPALRAYTLISDPGTLSIYDKTAIPAERLARPARSP